MKRNLRVLTSLFVIMISIFVFNFKVGAAFPSTISATYNGTITQNGTTIMNKAYNNTARAFCTRFWYTAPYGSCSATTWNSNATTNKKIAVAIGAMITKTRSLSGGSAGQIDADKYFYGEMAINYFLYNYNGKNSANNVTSLYNWGSISSNSNYIAIYSAGVTAYNNYGKPSVQFTNPRISISEDRKTVTASITLTCYDAKGNAVSCSAAVSKTLTVTGTDEDDGAVSQVLNATYTKSTSPNIHYDFSYTHTFAKAFKASTKVTGSFQTKNKVTYVTAQNYNCGSSYQSLTPNLLMDMYEYPETKKTVSTTTNNCIITVNKTGEGGAALKGAKLRLFKVEGGTQTAIETGVSNASGQIVFDGLIPGSYAIKEIQAPSGYLLSSETKTVELTSESCNQTVPFTNTKATGKLKILKVDESGNAVAGAKIRVFTVPDNATFNFEEAMGSIENDTSTETGGESNTLDNNSYNFDYVKDPSTNNPYFITTTTPIEITGLTIGETYYVYEESVPENSDYAVKVGSAIAEITGTSTVTVQLENVHSRFKISKQDITSKKELPGATLQILDSRGLVVEVGNEKLEWVSTDTQKEILGLEDGEYTLVEITAPKGYKKTESIKFTIENGKLKDDEDNILVMYDDIEKVPVPDTLSARNILIVVSGMTIVGAGLAVFLYGVKKKDEF